jgi:hypothetical protein
MKERGKGVPPEVALTLHPEYDIDISDASG